MQNYNTITTIDNNDAAAPILKIDQNIKHNKYFTHFNHSTITRPIIIKTT